MTGMEYGTARICPDGSTTTGSTKVKTSDRQAEELHGSAKPRTVALTRSNLLQMLLKKFGLVLDSTSNVTIQVAHYQSMKIPFGTMQMLLHRMINIIQCGTTA